MTMMAMARQVMTKTLMATDVDDDDNEGDKSSSTTCNEGDNPNCDNGEGMDTCGSCATKGRHASSCDATNSRQTRGKREERCQQTRGDEASIGQGCKLRGGCRV